METSASCQPVKKRIAHIPKNTSSAGCLPRPRIPVEYGAKVPQNQRQRYLDRIIDEYLRLCSNEKDAYEKVTEQVTTSFYCIETVSPGYCTSIAFDPGFLVE